MEKLNWKNERRVVDDLLPYEGNPRKMSEDQANQLKRSLEEFNLVEIPAIDTDNTIIAGHMRMKTMQLLGRGQEEIDVRVPNRKLTSDEFIKYNLRSNNTTGENDWDVLANFDKELLLDIGFTPLEIGSNLQIPIDDQKEIDGGVETKNHCPSCGYDW